ncbi:hypothetical protein ABI59_11765 [Acidobacteria bacterium Mor1]|nr:hypothetical protein ABI59_11765 [Acidobacteria bacterium Mor1]
MRSRYVSMASTDPDGHPRVTPIGSLMLKRDGTGCYGELFAHGLGKNVDRDDRVTILAVSASKWLWLDALIRGRFRTVPGARLRARIGELRDSTEVERRIWFRRIRGVRWTRGSKMIWEKLPHVREVTIESIEPVRIGPMTKHLWPARIGA